MCSLLALLILIFLTVADNCFLLVSCCVLFHCVGELICSIHVYFQIFMISNGFLKNLHINKYLAEKSWNESSILYVPPSASPSVICMFKLRGGLTEYWIMARSERRTHRPKSFTMTKQDCSWSKARQAIKSPTPREPSWSARCSVDLAWCARRKA